ncbi:MAG: hypothetical protein ABW024_01995 [Microbacterium sp.]
MSDPTSNDARSVPPLPAPLVEPPSPDVAAAEDATPLPGAHRGGFQRLPTAPLDVTTQVAPPEPGSAEHAAVTAEWLMPTPRPSRGLAGWALGFAIAGLLVSLVVGWGFPLGLVGLILAIVALRRPFESRAVAVWTIVLSGVSFLYSAGWLWWAATQANLFG